MKNRDFRLFDISKLPIMTDNLAKELVSTIGNRLYDDQKQKLTFKLKMIDRFGSKCAYCGAELDISSNEQIDHFYPIDESNRNSPNNLLLTCFLCNNAKRKNVFSKEAYPYSESYSRGFKRDKFGCIVPADSNNTALISLAEKLRFSSISRTVTYAYLLIDYLFDLLEKKSYDINNQLISSLAIFKTKLVECSKSLYLKEQIDNL